MQLHPQHFPLLQLHFRFLGTTSSKSAIHAKCSNNSWRSVAAVTGGGEEEEEEEGMEDLLVDVPLLLSTASKWEVSTYRQQLRRFTSRVEYL
jgi:hypothetical protein